MTAQLGNQVDPYGNDASDEHRPAWCETCTSTHYPDEHEPINLSAPELATLRAAVQLTIAGPQYTDRHLVDLTIAARGIPNNADNRRHYRDHISSLVLRGLLELDSPNAPIEYENTIGAAAASFEFIRDYDRSNR